MRVEGQGGDRETRERDGTEELGRACGNCLSAPDTRAPALMLKVGVRQRERRRRQRWRRRKELAGWR